MDTQNIQNQNNQSVTTGIHYIDDKKIAPPNESAKTIAKDAWDKLPQEEQDFLNNIAIEIVDAYTKGNMGDCHRLFYKNNLDTDEQTALWSRLDSKQRSAIKAHNESLKEVK